MLEPGKSAGKSRDLRSAAIVRLLLLSSFSVFHFKKLSSFVYLLLNSWRQELMHLCQMEWLPNDVTNKWFYLHKASAPLQFVTPNRVKQSVSLLITLIFIKLSHRKSQFLKISIRPVFRRHDWGMENHALFYTGLWILAAWLHERLWNPIERVL